MTRGMVVFWNDVEGWGVLRSPDIPSDVFAHFSMISQPGGGYRALSPGESVLFTWEARRQDDYSFCAIEIFREGAVTISGPERSDVSQPDSRSAYSSEIQIERDSDH
ncbi:cold-shock protein [Microtetraspora fusca]|uniref:Cold-shock protein n=1 Tax=Microtetraspora fusca TaxID=1997 RepID=A0ABW6VBB3_MICFU|nr:cold shock domain-containing protein [Microtetraspora fusca]